jgi:prevent-host-death family protein
MPKTISASDLRSQIKRILNEVGYGQVRYVVERFGEPTAAIISVDDLRTLQEVKRERAEASLWEAVDAVRERAADLDPQELHSLIEEARSEFWAAEQPQDDV